jgi:multicomponent Na+:H+ antiporter subunit F
MNEMNLWIWAALAMCIAVALCMLRCFRGAPGDRLVALEFVSVAITLQMMLLIEGFARSTFYDVPLTLAFLSFGGGMVFVRFLERWL